MSVLRASDLEEPEATCAKFTLTEGNGTVDQLFQQLNDKGYVVIHDVYTAEQIGNFKAEHDRLFKEVQDHLSQTPSVMRTYLNKFGKLVTKTLIPFWDMPDGSVTLELAPGRYDFTWGMDKGIFSDESFHEPPILLSLMKKSLKCHYSHYTGALPSQAKSDYGPWHRDVYDMFPDGNEDDTIDVTLPPYYFTVLVPLVRLTTENGATEIIAGSHRKKASECENGEHFHAVCEPGSIVVFDGRCCHRGMPNQTADQRPVLYMVWHKTWYNDFGSFEGDFPNGSWRHGH